MTPSLSELFEGFLSFEEENALFTRSVKGHLFWDTIRPAVSDGLLATLLSSSAVPPRPATQGRLRRYIRYGAELVSGCVFAIAERLRPRKRYDVVIVNFNRKHVINGRQVNMNCTPVIEHLASRYSVLVIDPSESSWAAREKYPCDVFVAPHLNYFDHLRAHLFFYSRKERQLFAEIRSALFRRFGVDIDIGALVRRYFSFHLNYQSRFRKLLSRYCPRVVICAHHDKAVAEAARICGVIAIELQHSMVSPYNIAYNYPPTVPPNLPTLPHYVFTFGTYWDHGFRLPAVKTAVGYPFFDIKARGIRLPPDSSPTHRERARRIIIVSNFFSKEAFVEVALQLSSLLPETTIYYKLKFSDYRDWRRRYPPEMQERPNIIVIDDNQKSLYDYFALCGYQIGTNSGGLYEGLYFGVVPVILKTGWYEETRGLYENGYAFLVSRADEVADLVRTGARPGNFLGREELFKSSSLANIEKEVTRMIAP